MVESQFENNRFETIWIEVNLKSKIFLICSFYRSEFSTTQTEFTKELQSSIERALDYTPNIVLTCDININFINLVNSEIRDCLNLFNLTNVINEPTRVVGNSATLIDPVLVSDARIVLESGTIQVDNSTSDHKGTNVSLKSSISLLKSYTREIWNYKNADFDTLNELVCQFDWESVINENLFINQSGTNFTHTFIMFCKQCIPRKKCSFVQMIALGLHLI